MMHTLQADSSVMTGGSATNLPSFSLTEKDLPEIKEWKVGKRYKLEMEVEQVEISKDEYALGTPIRARFRIHKIKNDSYTEEEKRGRMGK